MQVKQKERARVTKQMVNSYTDNTCTLQFTNAIYVELFCCYNTQILLLEFLLVPLQLPLLLQCSSTLLFWGLWQWLSGGGSSKFLVLATIVYYAVIIFNTIVAI